MKILQLCKKFPFPLKDGESIAVTNLSKALNTLDCEVSLLAMNTKKHYFDLSQLPESFNHYQSIHVVPIDNSIYLKDAFFNLWKSESYHISRFVSDAFNEQLKKLLSQNEYDVIQLETLYLAPYISTIRKYSKAQVAMRAHNVEHEIWQRVMEKTKSIPKRIYLKHLVKKLALYEKQQLNQYDILVPITDRDLGIFKTMGYEKEAVVTPIGIETGVYPVDNRSFKKDISLSFIGSLDWMPNQEGLVWFMDNVWQSLVKQYPDLQLHIAGRNTPTWLMDKKLKNVTIYGEIPDASQFINQHSVMIVPLFAGSGMRAKILEGMALGKVVLSTSLGLEGIPAKDKKEVLIANSPKEFIEGIEFCYQSNGQLKSIGNNARNFVDTHYDNLHIAKNLLKAYKARLLKVPTRDNALLTVDQKKSSQRSGDLGISGKS